MCTHTHEDSEKHSHMQAQIYALAHTCTHTHTHTHTHMLAYTALHDKHTCMHTHTHRLILKNHSESRTTVTPSNNLFIHFSPRAQYISESQHLWQLAHLEVDKKGPARLLASLPRRLFMKGLVLAGSGLKDTGQQQEFWKLVSFLPSACRVQILELCTHWSVL